MIDRYSETWKNVNEWANGLMTVLIDDLILEDSDIVRGKIQMLTDLLDLPSKSDHPPKLTINNY